MNKLTKDALKVSSIFAVIVFLLGFSTKWSGATIIEAISTGLFGGLIIGAISFLVARSAIRNKLKLKWWQWIFYVIGWWFGFGNIFFWFIMFVLHILKNKGQPIDNLDFHKRVYVWGIVVCILILVTIGLTFVIQTFF